MSQIQAVRSRVVAGELTKPRPAAARSHLVWARRLAVLFLTLVILASGVPPAAADAELLQAPGQGGRILALVIGIDHYKNTKIAPVLNGAVADANDIAATLTRMGVTNLKLLLEEQVTRAALEAAMAEVEQDARRGDLVIATYAGHGSREKELVAGSEPDGKDEFFVLWGFDSKGPGTAERMVDDQVFDWLKRIAARGAGTIFVADSCYGGGMTKGIQRRPDGPSVRAIERVDEPEQAGRGAYYIAPEEDELPPVRAGSPDDDATSQLAGLSFISGVDDKHLAPEVRLADQPTPRGAASFAFARALEGVADREGDRNGATTRAELFGFLHRTVAHLSQNQQAPDTKPRTLETASVILFRGSPSSPETAVAASKREKLSTAGLAPGQVLSGVLWDGATGNAIDYSGAVLAFGIAKTDILKVEQRVSAFRILARLASGRAIDTALNPGDRNLKNGERFELAISGIYGRHLILINLAGNGTVQFLFPAGNAPNYMDKNELTIPLKVGAPFGSDTIVVVASSQRRRELEADLKSIDEKTASLDLAALLEKGLDAEDRLGLATYTTVPN
ncbi:MAG: caspase family protein [Hyphomicrobium sp.]